MRPAEAPLLFLRGAAVWRRLCIYPKGWLWSTSAGRGLDIAARLHRIDECLPGESCLGI